MATWVNFCRTEQGRVLDAKLVNGSIPLRFTKAMSGSEKINPVLLPTLTELPGAKQTLTLSDKLCTDDPTEVILPVMLQNKGLAESYKMYILGLYAEDPDLGEILYMVCQTTTEEGEEIPSETNQPAFSIQWNHVIKTADASKVVVEVPEAGLLTEHIADQKYALKSHRHDVYDIEGFENLNIDLGYFDDETQLQSHNLSEYAHQNMVLNGNEIETLASGETSDLQTHMTDPLAHPNLKVDGNG